MASNETLTGLTPRDSRASCSGHTFVKIGVPIDLPAKPQTRPTAKRHAGIDVSIIMPCLNEAATLPWCIERAAQALDALSTKSGLSGEIIVADNGSTDGSQRIAKQRGARVITIEQRGYGAALRGGMSAARGTYLVMGDSDCSYDFTEAVPMVERLMAGADLCMGSRFRGEIKPKAMPVLNRHLGNPLLSGIFRLFYRLPVSDAHCGLRALTKTTFERLRLDADGMEFATEMVLKASLLDCRYAETPVTLSPDQRGRKPHLRPWRDGWRHLRYMLMLSPLWLFFGPSILFSLLAVLIITPLLLKPDGSMITIVGLPFGDHWMILASAFLIVAFQTALFGFAATIHGVREGYRRITSGVRRVLMTARLEHFIVAASILILTGCMIFMSVLTQWADQGYGELSAIRPITAASTLGVLGLQSFFGGFLLSIIAGNRAHPADLMAISNSHKHRQDGRALES
ncbi:glycosyltransferase family 2 protein [Thiorhodococcus minor]|uniref:Glycosyltransferase family 2 protein n=1 Tax=Thiorhodococcus minor TaxID=57489 RepID=A0A6M0K258_9GAMM|nr:glycosyltransferase family 2 protein [Thiorhodococcus minor]NEV63013.1 glycosyltransferase family 2 protein [Thiorhodococcus minor]